MEVYDFFFSLFVNYKDCKWFCDKDLLCNEYFIDFFNGCCFFSRCNIYIDVLFCLMCYSVFCR